MILTESVQPFELVRLTAKPAVRKKKYAETIHKRSAQDSFTWGQCCGLAAQATHDEACNCALVLFESQLLCFLSGPPLMRLGKMS